MSILVPLTIACPLRLASFSLLSGLTPVLLGRTEPLDCATLKFLLDTSHYMLLEGILPFVGVAVAVRDILREI